MSGHESSDRNARELPVPPTGPAPGARPNLSELLKPYFEKADRDWIEFSLAERKRLGPMLKPDDGYGDSSNHERGTPAFDDTVIGEIKTFTGKYVKPMAMTPDMFSIADIGHSLARICRYGGHCHGFLSVAEHSVRVMELCPDEFKLDGLLHDRMEAYLGDVCRPIKRLPEMQFYRDAEERGEKASALTFGVTYPMPPEVKAADRAAFLYEVEHCRDNVHKHMTPNEAKRLFMHAYYDLTGLKQ